MQVLTDRYRQHLRYGLFRENCFLDDGVYTPVAIHHLRDTEVNRDRDQRDCFIFGQVARIHEEATGFVERVCHAASSDDFSQILISAFSPSSFR